MVAFDDERETSVMLKQLFADMLSQLSSNALRARIALHVNDCFIRLWQKKKKKDRI